MAELLFYLLSAGTLGFGVGVVALRNPLFSVLSLLGSFVCLAGIYLVAGFQFLAAAQLLVYAGAVMVLFLFAVMLLNLGDEAGDEASEESGENPFVALTPKRMAFVGVAVLGLALVGLIAASSAPTLAAEAASAGGTEAAVDSLDDLSAIATLLFSRYALAFQAAGLLLLIAMVAVIVLAKRHGAGLRRPPTQGLPRSEFSLGDSDA